MKFERHVKEEPGVNLTPLIDVVFLLLIFFMVTTTFNRESSMQVNLPESSSESAPAPAAPVDVMVTSDGHYVVNGQTVVNSTLDTLKTAIEQASEGNNNLPVVLTADADSTHQSVVTAMDAIGQLGFTQLSIATREVNEKE